jgi:hypothetical protein
MVIAVAMAERSLVLAGVLLVIPVAAAVLAWRRGRPSTMFHALLAVAALDVIAIAVLPALD